MALLDHTPTVDVVDAQRIARDLFGIDGAVTSLPSERDRNFRIEASDGREFVLKVANGSETRDVLEAQMAVAARAGESGVPVQGAHAALSGALIETSDGHMVRLLDHLPGTLLIEALPGTTALRFDLGTVLGRLAKSLEGFDHPAAHRDFYWDVVKAPEVVRERGVAVTDPQRTELLQRLLVRLDTEVVPRLPALRQAIIHGDANDRNVLVEAARTDDPAARMQRITGLLDFGDMVFSAVVAEPAVAAAYVAMDAGDPVGAVGDVFAGFDSQFPLTDDELAVAWNLVLARLSLSVTNAAVQSAARPDDPYLVVSEAPAWRTLERLLDINPEVAHARLRWACGRVAHAAVDEVVVYLEQGESSPLLGTAWQQLNTVPVDLSVGSPWISADDLQRSPEDFEARVIGAMRGADAVGLGGYGEARLVYTTAAFAPPGDDPAAEWRTVHLGVDIWVPEGTPLHAPLTGTVRIVRDNATPLDYGPMVVLQHETDHGVPFFSLYGHLARRTLDHLVEGQRVESGSVFAWVGEPAVNGGWAPHAHVQVIVDLMGLEHDYPGVAVPSQHEMWMQLSPDPALFLSLPAGSVPTPQRPIAETLADRQRLFGYNLSVSYASPLRIVRGIGSRLYDDKGRAYLDGVNNVAHVGHAHPHVVHAAQRQMSVLNTNTRYLHDTVLDYAERLTATLPESLSVCFFVNSGSEANDLALRMIRAHTGVQDVVCVEHGYHGHTQALIDVSHYKNQGRGGQGAPPWVHTARMPDPYRGEFRGYSRQTSLAYAADVQRCIDDAGGRVAGMIVESMIGCGGQVVLPDHYLAEAATLIRAAGGLMIADEVQVGFGRVGPAFWGFATQGLVPDIVTMGKPAGNGHPLAVVVTTPEVAASFANGMEYFNTFGGNAVSAATGLAVLDVIEREQLPANALRVGARIEAGVSELAQRHELIGDVRGLGLYLGVELVRDRATLEPADSEASFVIEECKNLGVLVSIDGPFHNVLKIKPPLVWTEADADRLVATLDRVLSDSRLHR